MRHTTNIKFISNIKVDAAEALYRPAEDRTTWVATQNGEAHTALHDGHAHEDTQQTLALLKLLAWGQQDLAAGRVGGVDEVVARLRTRHGLKIDE